MKLVYSILLIGTLYSQYISDNTYSNVESSAMAGAVVAERGGAWSIFINPAGIVETKQKKLLFAASTSNLYGYSWLPLHNLTFTSKLPILGKMSFAMQQFETKYNGISLSKEQIISFGKGYYLQNDKNSNLSFGHTINIIKWNLGKSAGLNGDGSDGLILNNAQTISLDIGFLSSLRNKFRFGAYLKNISSSSIGKGISSHTLPQRINVGITYLPAPFLSTSIVSEHLLGSDNIQTKAAFKYNLNSNIILYTGAQSNPNRFGIGIKFILADKFVSYGFLSHQVLPITHQVNLGFSL